MAEQPAAVTAASSAQDAVPASTVKPSPRPPPNPAFRAMGIPNFRLRLPSRNWLIFLSITGSFTTALLYDRYHKKAAQRRWCKVVSHLAEETLPTTQMPRTITIFLSAPPGDGLRAAREHFHEYVKPILVAGALDWEVIEGRREGEVRATLASKIRRLRRRSGEHSDEVIEESVQDRLEDFRRGAQITDWDGIQGDIVLGRHTWKEYVRGLHEGWIGPLDPPKLPEQASPDPISPTTGSTSNTNSPEILPLPETPETATTSSEPSAPSSSSQDADVTNPEPSPQPESKPPEKPPPKPSPLPPYILPPAYPAFPLAPSTPSSLPPSTILPFPHLLGFFNTPIRIYRFLTRRRLADETGRSVAMLVLARDTRAFERGREFLSSADPDNAAPTLPLLENTETDVIEAATTAWEQESVLVGEEAEWHKSAWTPNKDDEANRDRERPWKEKMVTDERIGTRMRTFALDVEEEGERVKRAEAEIGKEDREAEGMVDGVLKWLGWRDEGGLPGWEMGKVGREND